MNGILLIDKPSGWTSSDVVAKLRGILHERRIGHSGTLDPMATGLLVVFIGRATRAVEFAESHSKRYLAGLRLGVCTDTQDTSGRVLSATPASISETMLETALEAFRGEISQMPPMYSAIKINGQKLYEIARKGGSVERKARQITIHDLKLIGRDGEDFILDISCSKGTYVRTLCSDIGDALGCGGCMSSLRRVCAGDFSIASAYSLEQVQATADSDEVEKLLLPLDVLFAAYPSVEVSTKGERSIKNGGGAYASNLSDGFCRVYSQNGEFLALGNAAKGEIKVVKSFFEV